MCAQMQLHTFTSLPPPVASTAAAASWVCVCVHVRACMRGSAGRLKGPAHQPAECALTTFCLVARPQPDQQALKMRNGMGEQYIKAVEVCVCVGGARTCRMPTRTR